MSAQAMIFADWGKTVETKAVFAELRARATNCYIQPSHLAIAASAAGDMDAAVRYFRHAFEIRDPMLMMAKHWPHFGRLHEDPRFNEILVRLGLK